MLTKAQTPTKLRQKQQEKSTVSPKPEKTDSSSSNVTANSEYSKQANKIINKHCKDMKDVERQGCMIT